MSGMEFANTPEFQKDLKRLRKKYRSLNQDIAVVKQAIAALPTGDGSKHWVVKNKVEDTYVMKMRMMCRSVKGAQFRLVYGYNQKTVTVLCLELYYKGDQVRETSDRIDEYLKRVDK